MGEVILQHLRPVGWWRRGPKLPDIDLGACIGCGAPVHSEHGWEQWTTEHEHVYLRHIGCRILGRP